MNGRFKLNTMRKKLARALCFTSIVLAPIGFSAPATSAPLDDSVRLLNQATFGPDFHNIDALKGTTLESWIQAQIELPATYHRELFEELETEDIEAEHRVHAWFFASLHAQDQLRQRMAFALSQIFVVSQFGNLLAEKQGGLFSYYDMLIEHGLGNYRDLMFDVTMHPVMGSFLTYAPNEKAAEDGSTEADENYARELLQLMTLGPYLLNLDGSFQLDEQGQRIPTYTEAHIKSFAKVFTGLCYVEECDPFESQMIEPLEAHIDDHDMSEKVLLNRTLPADPDSVLDDINGALDDIFEHPNLAPFVSQRLIQMLVTSNPSPQYLARVASVFNDNGEGEKGDLAATVTAILLDEEAREGHLGEAANTFGKLKEPLLMLTHLLRATHAFTPEETPFIPRLFKNFGQAPLNAPSVFNFYHFDHTPHSLAQGLVAPEFEMSPEDQLLERYDLFFRLVKKQDFELMVNIIEEAESREAGIENLINYFDLMLTQGQMSPLLREEIAFQINGARQKDTRRNGKRKNKFTDRHAIINSLLLILTSAEFTIQR